jgi:choline dehydrogenase-like flavoprotein
VTRSVIIIGAGPAAAAAALACTRHDDVQVTVLDVGGQLEQEHQQARLRLASQPASEWQPHDLRTITRQPVLSGRSPGLPEKRAFGSDFPFRDFGQRAGLVSEDPVSDALISGAYGGFSNVWGAQVMPFTDRTFDDWPVPSDEMRRHYGTILHSLPFAGEHDDLAELFPLLAPVQPLPPMSERSGAVLESYRRHRARLRARGVVMGRARLAMSAPDCVRCGLCMTGCPYGLVYSASQTFDSLRRHGRVDYHDGLLAVRVDEAGDRVTVQARDVVGGGHHTFVADRVMIACGAIGSSRLVMGSLGLYGTPVRVQESTQFMLPFLSARPSADPRHTADFTLNQFNMVVDLDGGHDVSQLHFYSYNPAFLEALPAMLRTPFSEPARRALLRRLTVALGYLPSWASPSFRLEVRAEVEPSGLPKVMLTPDPSSTADQAFLRRVLRKVVGAAPLIDLWPALPALAMSAPGKSYHWGGTFPHTSDPAVGGPFASDLLGRVGSWRRVHVVDAAVFPTVPATTFTLTIMANAHRIADAALQEAG